jgi:hypothetical protein
MIGLSVNANMGMNVHASTTKTWIHRCPTNSRSLSGTWYLTKLIQHAEDACRECIRQVYPADHLNGPHTLTVRSATSWDATAGMTLVRNVVGSAGRNAAVCLPRIQATTTSSSFYYHEEVYQV